MGKRFYVTTPIYYSNDVPHLGHLSTTVYADIIARFKRLMGFDVVFLTGSDEHGEKVYGSALKAKKPPQEFVDEMAERWKAYWKSVNIKNDIFMRTTYPEHAEVVHKLLNKINAKGDIYKSRYKGLYCVGCEEFKTERQLVDGKCPEHRKDQISQKEEENYFFALSKYIPKVKNLLEKGGIDLFPKVWRNEMLSRLEKEDIHDMSISRQNVSWGVKLPWDKSQTVYVWVEALMNYYSATLIFKKEEFWPADMHIVGKGNNWFHSVIWPALLLSLDFPLPKRIFIHGYYNIKGVKMSKSLGNVISPKDLTDRYGVDGTRVLLCKTMPYSSDSSVSFARFDRKYNTILANGFGNLVSRVSNLAKGIPVVIDERGLSFKSFADDRLKGYFNDMKLHKVIDYLEEETNKINGEINRSEPWKKEGKDREREVNRLVLSVLRLSVLFSPIAPETSEKVKKVFLNKEGVEKLPSLFPRTK